MCLDSKFIPFILLGVVKGNYPAVFVLRLVAHPVFCAKAKFLSYLGVKFKKKKVEKTKRRPERGSHPVQKGSGVLFWGS